MGFIGLGKFSKYNIYILIATLSEILKDCLVGINIQNEENQGKLFYFIPKFKSHSFIQEMIFFLSSFCGGVVLYCIHKKTNKIKKGELSIRKYEILRQSLLGQKNQNIYLALFLAGFFFSINRILKCFVALFQIYFGLWLFEILYICILSYIILKININNHKKAAILIVIGPVIIIEFIGFYLPYTKVNCDKEECNELSNTNSFEGIKIKWGVYFIPLILLFNDLINIFRDYAWVKSKYLMDIRSIPPYKIFFSIGIIGTILIIILFPIFTYIPCKTYNDIILNDKGDYIYRDNKTKIDFFKVFCNLKKYNKDEKKLYIYFDNFSLFLKDYERNKESYIEIFAIIPLYFIICFTLLFSYIMMIRLTDPNTILISRNLLYFIERIVCIILNKGNEKYISHTQFFLLELQEIIYIISNMIYIEIIELRFCKLDYDLTKNIRNRSDNDYLYSSIALLEENETEENGMNQMNEL